MFFFNVSWTFVLVFLLVLGSDYRIPLSHHVLVAASTICAFPIWTATARAVVMCAMKPPGSAVYLEHFRSKVRDFIPSWPANPSDLHKPSQMPLLKAYKNPVLELGKEKAKKKKIFIMCDSSR